MSLFSAKRRLGVVILLAGSLAAPAVAKDDRRLAQAQTLIDAEKPQEALSLLDEVLRKGKPDPGALLLRSTARLMLADLKGGYEDLRQAVAIDPTLRQAWLNLAGLEIASQRYDAAYQNLLEAEKLDPEAADNGLNLGAVLVLKGEIDAAGQQFARHLAKNPSAEAWYLVAANYALAGRETPAVDHLRRAIEIDERSRLRARSDDRFVLLEGPAMRRLLETDLYQPPAGSLVAAIAFKTSYDRTDRKLLDATLDALQKTGWRYDPRIEATATWALVWGDVRVKLDNQADGTGVVSLSAPAGSFDTAEWQRKTQALFQTINENLTR